jgi:uncharacterized protein (DUF2249 family)
MALMKIQDKHITVSMQVLLVPSVLNFVSHHFPSYPLTAQMHGGWYNHENESAGDETTHVFIQRRLGVDCGVVGKSCKGW